VFGAATEEMQSGNCIQKMFNVDPMVQDVGTTCLVFTAKFRGTFVAVLAALFLVLFYFVWFGCLDL